MRRKKNSKENKNIHMNIKEPRIADGGEYVFGVPQEEIDVQNAPLWRRAIAYLIDILFFYFFPFQIFIAVYLPKVGLGLDDIPAMEAYINSNPDASMRMIIGVIASLFVFLAYFMLFEKNFGTTIGKKIMKIRIDKKDLTYKDTFIRNLTKTVFIFLLPFDLIGLALNGQRFTEKWTNTKDIYESRLSLKYEVW